MSAAQIAAMVQAARRRAFYCDIHERRLERNGRTCVDCIIVARTHTPGLTMRPIRKIMEAATR